MTHGQKNIKLCYGLYGLGFEPGGGEIFRILPGRFGGPPTPCRAGTVHASQE